MDYPIHLLPRPDYHRIAGIEALKTCVLQRTTDDTNILDPETQTIRPGYISIQTGHLSDLSTNLIGVFTPEDRCWKIIGEKTSYYAREPWADGEPVTIPSYLEDFEHIGTRGAIYFLVDNLEGLSIPYDVKGEDGFIAVCKILHTPVRSNFWHFSLRWFNQDGDVLNQNGSWRRRMLTFARAALIHFGRLDPPDYGPIPSGLYS